MCMLAAAVHLTATSVAIIKDSCILHSFPYIQIFSQGTELNSLNRKFRVKLITVHLVLCTFCSCRWRTHTHMHATHTHTQKQQRPQSSANHESHYPNVVIMP